MHRWYSMSREYEVVDHEPVAIDEAIAIARDYFRRADTNGTGLSRFAVP